LFVLLGTLLVPFPLFLILVRCVIRRWLRNACGHSILEVLERPYAANRRWWESMGMLRRLVLLSLAIFVLQPIWKAVSLFAGCFLVFLSHLYLQPYDNPHYGRVEAFFLCDLVFVSALNIPQAVYTFLGLVDRSGTSEALQYAEMVLILLPMGYCVAVVIWVQSQKFFRCVMKRVQNRDEKKTTTLS